MNFQLKADLIVMAYATNSPQTSKKLASMADARQIVLRSWNKVLAYKLPYDSAVILVRSIVSLTKIFLGEKKGGKLFH